jgi:hypothetical protein
MKYLNNIFIFCLLILTTTSCHQEKNILLFDGQTLSGWEGSSSAFRLENGTIVGGSLEKGLEESFYLCTTEEYSDFELTLAVKLSHNSSMANAGVSFRAERVKGSNEVASYQADIGYTNPKAVVRFSDHTPADMNTSFSLWGALIDECRVDVSRYPDPEFFPAVILKMPERELIHKIVKPDDWNQIQVLANRNEIEIKINGITTAKFTENGEAASKGYICLQAHQGEPYEIHYKDIRLRKID